MASRLRAAPVALLLSVAACAAPPPPVTAEKILDVPGIRAVVNAVALSPDGGLVVVGDLNGDLVARAVASGAELWSVRVPARRVDGIVFSPDGSSLVSIGHEARTLELWDAVTGRQSLGVEIGNSRAAVFHPTERMLVIGAATTIHVVDLARGEVVRTLPNAHQGDRVDVAAFSSNGQVLATASMEGSLKLWNWPALTLRTSMQMAGTLEPMTPVSLILDREGTRAAANGIMGRVHVVDASRGREERTFASVAQAPGHGMHAEMRYSLEFSRDGDWLFAPDTHDRGVRLLHLSSGTTHNLLTGAGPFYKAVSLAVPAGRLALLRPGDAEGRGPYGLEVWQLTTVTR